MTFLVVFNKTRTFTITKNDKSITLSKKAMVSLIKDKNRILTDLKIGNGEEQLHWEKDATRIFTRGTNVSEQKSLTINKQMLFIVKNTTTITFDKDEFVNLLSNAKALIKIEQSPSVKMDRYYKLTSGKKIKIESKDNTFTILDNQNNRSVTFPLSALAALVEQKDRIFRDLQSNEEVLSPDYWKSGGFFVYTKVHLYFRVLCFVPGYNCGRVCIIDTTFQKLIDLLGDFFGEEDFDYDESEDESEKFGEKIRINSTKKVQFSINKKHFFLISKTDRKQELTLPIVALDTLSELKSKILADFSNKVVSFNGRDYLNEYWSNDEYAIRTAVYERGKVLRFDGKKRNIYIISMKEPAFRTLLEIYEKQKIQ